LAFHFQWGPKEVGIKNELGVTGGCRDDGDGDGDGDGKVIKNV